MSRVKDQLLVLPFLLLALPASSNYSLQNYGFGGGGIDGGSSSNYGLHAISGETGAMALSGSSYQALPGLEFELLAAQPAAPTLENSANNYNKLLLTIDNGDNPSDAEFAVAISTDNFVSDIRYVQDDNTVGESLGSEDWQTYTDWGGASGENILGLDTDTTYYVKVKARQGQFSEGGWGPTSSASTSAVELSFDIDVASADQESAAPYNLDFGELAAGSVTTASDKIWLDLTTNADNGGFVYIYGSHGGLYSSTHDYTISAVSANLSSISEGFGLQVSSTTQSSGGPLTASSPFNGSDNNVGNITTTAQNILHTSTAPITSGRGAVDLKAKINQVTPAASDYAETLTLISTASF